MKKAILVSCWDWYENRLIYIEEYLQNKGYSIEIWMSDFSHLEKRLRRKNETNTSVSYIHVPPYKRNISVKRLYSHNIFSKNVAKKIKKSQPDLVYCLIPPNSLVKELVKVKKNLGCKLILDVIDLWPESFPKGNKNLWIFRLWKKVRDNHINLADRIILECDYYKEVLSGVDNSKLDVLRLIKKPIEGSCEFKPYEQDICLGYLGSINSLIDIEKICEIVKLLSTSKSVLIRIVGEGENRERFIQSLKMAGAKVEFYGTVYEDKELMYILGGCHFGINIYKKNIKVGLTMKSVSYFQLGLPILNSISGDTKKMVDQCQIGINVEELSFEKILNYIGDMESHKKRVNKVFMEFFSPQVVRDIFLKMDGI